MPIGGLSSSASSASPTPLAGATSTTHRHQRLTPHAAISIAIAASGGALFGWDLGVTGGVSTSDSFLDKFFPDIAARKRAAKKRESGSDPYCVYDSQTLTLFTSSAFLAAALTTLFVAGAVTRRKGRRFSMAVAGFLFVVGIGLCAGAVDLGMLIAGRLLIGIAIGFANQAVPLFLSEIPPTRLRGAVNVVFQLFTTLTIMLSQLANLVFLSGSDGGGQRWRASVGLALLPSLVLLLGSAFYLRDTPTSLASRGFSREGRRELERLRGGGVKSEKNDGGGGGEIESDGDDLDREWETIARAAASAHNNNNSSSPLTSSSSLFSPVREDLSSLSALFKRSAIPSTVVGVGIAFFSQVCGINAILFYAAPFFDAVMGPSSSSAAAASGLLSSVVVGLSLFGFTLVALCLVDRVGRRKLLFVGGTIMLASELTLSALLGHYLGHSSSSSAAAAKLLPRAPAAGALFLMCLFVAAFASSLGPLGWLVPTEVWGRAGSGGSRGSSGGSGGERGAGAGGEGEASDGIVVVDSASFSSADLRSAGQALATSVNFLFVFVTTQFFLPSLCAMRHWTFVAAAVAVALMLAFVAALMPETRGVHIEEVEGLFKEHAFWSRFFVDSPTREEEEDDDDEEEEEEEEGRRGTL